MFCFSAPFPSIVEACGFWHLWDMLDVQFHPAQFHTATCDEFTMPFPVLYVHSHKSHPKPTSNHDSYSPSFLLSFWPCVEYPCPWTAHKFHSPYSHHILIKTLDACPYLSSLSFFRTSRYLALRDSFWSLVHPWEILRWFGASRRCVDGVMDAAL